MLHHDLERFDREGMMRALSDDPISLLTWRDVPARLQRGEEYLDLQNPEAGVQRAKVVMAPTGGELARKAVRVETWERLLTYLAPCPRHAGHIAPHGSKGYGD